MSADAPAPGTPAASAGRHWDSEGIDQPWAVGEAIGVAMQRLRAHAGSLIVPVVPFLVAYTALAAAAVYALLPRRTPVTLTPSPLDVGPAPTPWALAVGFGALAFVALMFAHALVTEAALAAVRDEPVPAGRLGRAVRRVPKVAVLYLLIMLAALTPTGFLAVPLLFAPFVLVDEGASLSRALSRSLTISRPCLGAIWLLQLAVGPLFLFGWLSIVLSFVTLPLLMLGVAYGYVRATGRSALPWCPPEFASASLRRYLRVVFAALVLFFAGLVVWIQRLPPLRGAAWSIQDTAIRVSAILVGVAAVIVLLALLLPYALDRLEGRRFTSFVAARHVRSQKSGFLTVISILSICGVAMSSCSLSSVVSVMGGFSQDLKRKILGNNAHVVVDMVEGTPFAEYEDALARVRAVPGVSAAAGVVHGEVMASSAANIAGVMVSGVEPSSIKGVTDLAGNLEVGKLEYLEHPEELTKLPPDEPIGMGPGGELYYKQPELPALPVDEANKIDPDVAASILQKPERPGLILGRELAKTLHVYVGDEITLVSPLGDLGPMGILPRTKRFRVAGIFYSGMYEYDATYVYVMRAVAQDYFQTGDKVSTIEIKVEDAERAELVAPMIEKAIERPELRVRDWREINKNLFSALKLERFATFIILSIAIMVASFCIVCTLLLMVTEKGKEIAILKAVGASDGAILRIFMIEGVIIGAIGTVFGVVTGLSVCTGLKWFGLRLDPEVYYIDRLPITVSGWDFLTVALAALTICTLSTLYPAFSASRLRPVDGLRYE